MNKNKKTIRKFNKDTPINTPSSKMCLDVQANTLQALVQAMKWCKEDDALTKRIETAMYSVASALCDNVESFYTKTRYLVGTEVSAIVEAQNKEDATKQVYDSLMKQANMDGLNIQDIQDWNVKELD